MDTDKPRSPATPPHPNVGVSWLRRLIPRGLRNVIRRPSSTWRSLQSEWRYRFGQPSSFQVRPDWTVRCHPASLETYQGQRDEPEYRDELTEFIQSCRPGMVFLDIGAHYGAFTIAALHYGGASAQAIAVEPSSEAVRVLNINLKLAGATSRAHVFEGAAGARDGTLRMLTTGPAGDFFMVAADEPRADAVEIAQYCIAGIVTRTGLQPSHIKIDVEGFEDEVIDGGSSFLATHRPRIFLELHCALLRGRRLEPAALLEKLRSLGYENFERFGAPISIAQATQMDVARIVCVPAGGKVAGLARSGKDLAELTLDGAGEPPSGRHEAR